MVSPLQKGKDYENTHKITKSNKRENIEEEKKEIDVKDKSSQIRKRYIKKVKRVFSRPLRRTI